MFTDLSRALLKFDNRTLSGPGTWSLPVFLPEIGNPFNAENLSLKATIKTGLMASLVVRREDAQVTDSPSLSKIRICR